MMLLCGLIEIPNVVDNVNGWIMCESVRLLDEGMKRREEERKGKGKGRG